MLALNDTNFMLTKLKFQFLKGTEKMDTVPGTRYLLPGKNGEVDRCTNEPVYPARQRLPKLSRR